MRWPWHDIAAKAYFVLGVLALIVVPATLAMMGLGLIGFLLCLPLAAWLVSRILVSRGGGIVDNAQRKAVQEWHGAYYAFNDRQVRVYEDDGRLLFVATDVARALGWKALPQRFTSTHASRLRPIPGTKLQALDLEGLDLLLGKMREPACGRFLRWAHNEVVRPWERRRADEARPLRTPGT